VPETVERRAGGVNPLFPFLSHLSDPFTWKTKRLCLYFIVTHRHGASSRIACLPPRLRPAHCLLPLPPSHEDRKNSVRSVRSVRQPRNPLKSLTLCLKSALPPASASVRTSSRQRPQRVKARRLTTLKVPMPNSCALRGDSISRVFGRISRRENLFSMEESARLLRVHDAPCAASNRTCAPFRSHCTRNIHIRSRDEPRRRLGFPA
jgi:hypothetical protein